LSDANYDNYLVINKAGSDSVNQSIESQNSNSIGSDDKEISAPGKYWLFIKPLIG
jgi:hypothetical protein